ncbi:phytanoyl-CoA hydroxylase [Phlyctema vagabunda]|uniref:Phytanoyl-CoA hydroxylase n=1 Tax=Phlyctema vagabunda TaxID=108571 RepID=A0ABR4PEF5_9HELO
MALSLSSSTATATVTSSLKTPRLDLDRAASDRIVARPSDVAADSEAVGKLRATYLHTPIEEIRKRYAEDGYVWLKGLLPAEDIWNVRSNYFEFLAPTGLIKQGTDPKDGIYCGGDSQRWLQPGKQREGLDDASRNVEYEKRVTDAHSAPWYTSFANHPVLKDYVKKFTGWEETTLLQRSLFRPNVPGGEATPVHYDQIFLRAGPATALTAWVPLGNCAVDGGGLLYLENSVSLGQELERNFTEKAMEFTDEERVSAFNKNMMAGGFLERDLGSFSRTWGRKWLAANYEAGDVVLHDPYNIHCSATNGTDTIRLATDLRFVQSGKPFDQRWMKTWSPNDGL